MLQTIGKFLLGLFVLSFIFYMILFVMMGFPTPKWANSLNNQVKSEINKNY